MKISVLKKKYNFSEDNLSKIQQAVMNAEKNSEGEVAIAITPSSSFYTLWELLVAIVLSFLVSAFLVPFSSEIESFLLNVLWQTNSWSVPLFILAIQMLSIAFFYLLSNISAIDRIIVPRRVMDGFVQNKALRQFVLSGVGSTKKRTGILIFVSVLEKKVQIICDSGILSSTTQDEWDSIATELAQGFSSKDPSFAIIDALGKCANLFEQNFPLPQSECNENELSDSVIFVDGGEL